MARTSVRQRSGRPAAATAVALLGVLGAAGGLSMTAFHVGLYRSGALPVGVPLGFAVGALAFAAVAYGAWTVAAWSWPAAVLVNGLGLVASLFPWRGAQALAPAAVTLVALAVLASRAGREALLGRG